MKKAGVWRAGVRAKRLFSDVRPIGVSAAPILAATILRHCLTPLRLAAQGFLVCPTVHYVRLLVLPPTSHTQGGIVYHGMVVIMRQPTGTIIASAAILQRASTVNTASTHPDQDSSAPYFSKRKVFADLCTEWSFAYTFHPAKPFQPAVSAGQTPRYFLQQHPLDSRKKASGERAVAALGKMMAVQ